MNKKYSLTKNTIEWSGKTLFQIKGDYEITPIEENPQELSLSGKEVKVEIDGKKYTAIIK